MMPEQIFNFKIAEEELLERFQDFFQDFATERQNDAYQKVINTSCYIQENDQYKKMLSEIEHFLQEKLSSENFKIYAELIDSAESQRGLLECMFSDAYYMRGWRDALALQKIFSN